MIYDCLPKNFQVGTRFKLRLFEIFEKIVPPTFYGDNFWSQSLIQTTRTNCVLRGPFIAKLPCVLSPPRGQDLRASPDVLDGEPSAGT